MKNIIIRIKPSNWLLIPVLLLFTGLEGCGIPPSSKAVNIFDTAEITGRETAPVVAASSVEIRATPEKVWKLLTSFKNWPEWNPDVKSMTMDGVLAEGTHMKWKAGLGTITSIIQRIEEPRLIAWTGKTMGINAVHIWELEARDGRTLVKTKETWDGILVRVFPSRMRNILQGSLDTGMVYLKTAAEK